MEQTSTNAELPARSLQTQGANWFGVAVGGYALVGGLLSLAGWAGGIDRLKDWDASGVSIKANAAIGLAGAGLALLLLSIRSLRMSARYVVRALGAFVAILGGLTLFEHLTGWNLGIDTLLFAEAPGARATFAPGRFGITASVSFVLAGAAVFLISGNARSQRVASGLGFAVASISLVGLIGYLFNAQPLHDGPRLTSIALQAASMFLAVGVGIIAAMPDRGIGAIVTAPGPGGLMARRLLLAALWLPPLASRGALILVKAGAADASMAIALLCVAMMVLFALLVLAAAHVVERSAGVLRRGSEELARLNARQSAILNTALDAIVTMDQEGKITDFNPAAETIFGHHRDGAVGQPLAELIIPERFRQRHREGLARYLATGAGPVLGKRIELPALHADGHEFPAELAISRVGALEPPLFTATMRDISQRKGAEEALLESEQRFRALLKQAPLGVFLVDADFRLRQVNPTALPVFGNIPDLIGRDFEEVVRIIWPAAYADEIVSLYRRTLETGEPYATPERIETRLDTGVREYYEWRIDRVSLPDARYGVVCYFRDISEQVLTLAAMRDFHARLRFMAESMPQKIFTATPTGAVDYMNPQWSEFTGLSFEQIRDWGWTQFVHPEDVDENIRLWNRSIKTGEPFVFEHRFRRADGEYRWHLSRAHAMRDATGKITMWVGSNTNIHAQKSAAEKLAADKNELEVTVAARTAELERAHISLRATERMAAMGALSAGLGHDMGNLIFPIRARLEILALTPLPADAREDIESIGASITYLQQLSNGLKLLAVDPDRAGRMGAPAGTSPGDDPGAVTDLALWWADFLPVLRTALAPGVGAALAAKSVLDAALPAVAMPPAALSQAVFNLVQNAGDAIEAAGAALGRAGEVRVRISQVRVGAAGRVRIEVSDNGPGMSPEVLRRCMEPFYSTKVRRISTGMGLSLVKGLVEQAGGTLEVTSTEGEGATFILDLPAAPVTAVSATGGPA